MYFHLPLSISWDPDALMNAFDREISAEVVGTELRIMFPPERNAWWRKRYEKRRRTEESFDVAVRFYPDRFLRNLDLHPVSRRVPPTEPLLLVVENSILEIGALRLESADTEFSIAYRHYGDHVAINQMRAEIERLEAEKSRLVDLRDFRSAANVYDAEYTVRASLDTLLLHGQQNDEP